MINVKFLEQYSEFLEVKTKSNTKSTTTETYTAVPNEERTPREVMEDALLARAANPGDRTVLQHREEVP